MKTITLVFASALFFGATATFAQDTTKTRTDQQQSNQLNRDDLKGWTRVNTSDVPASLRTTLGGTQYKGWDGTSSTVYTNAAGEYYLRMGDRNNQKVYYFDKTGKAIAKPNKDN
jgi:hypothetical protein